MEEKNMSSLDPKLFILNELAQAKELLKQLDSDLHTATFTNGSKLLIPQILSYFENSLSMLKGRKSEAGNQSQITGTETASTPTDSPRSVNRSPRSDSERETPSKKSTRLRTDRAEGPQDDGYNWRKYGQKDILGATYPRGYYRCTYRNAQGCLALKQVQRSDEDSSIFNVMYRLRHTCTQAPHLLPGQSQNRHCQEHQKPTKSHGTILNFQTGCQVKTQDSGAAKLAQVSPSFSFSCIDKNENNSNIFSSTTPDNHFVTSPFSSPATSGSNSVFSNYGVNNIEGGQNLQTSDFDLCEFTSALDSQDLYLDFDFLDFNFRFDM
ncbi:hypothetical protein MKX01_007720 [Papaver californicum]|nr:hypothetical protein MKX01_007720 [Papaver californicum]